MSGNGAPGAIQILNSADVTICGNTFHRSAAATENAILTGTSPPPYPAHITFSGNVDSVSLCGNVYLPSFNPQDSTTSGDYDSVMVRPDYDYDVVPNSVLTNVSIADNPSPQNVGVCSPQAVLFLNCPNTAQPPQNALPAPNALTGLVLSNVGSGTQKVMLGAGSATDSTDSATITVGASGCQVNLANTGLNGLDVGGAVGPGQTYYFFVVSGPGGSNPSCMASASPVPSFINAPASYQLTQPATTTSTSPVVFGVGGQLGTPTSNPLGGMAVGQRITASSGGIVVSPPTTISSLQSFNLPAFSGTVHVLGTTYYVTTLVSLTNVAVGMAVVGQPPPSGGTGSIPPGAIVSAVNPTSLCTTPCFSFTPAAMTTPSTGAVMAWISGQYTVTLSQNAISTGTTNITVFAGLYRLVGALYTDSSSNIITFVQDNDTFYLAAPAVDINTTASVCTGPIGNSAVACALSVPSGLKVQAFGRIVGGSNDVIVFSPDQVPGTPGGFPGVPGYSIKNSGPDTAFAFSAYTDTSREIKIRASSSNTSVYEDTDGWIFKRAQ